MSCSVTATFSHSIFRSKDESYCVSLYKNQTGFFTAVGDHLPEALYPVTLEGNWENSPSHGTQFRVASVRIELPTKRADIISMLASMKAGFGKRKAEKLLNYVGVASFWNTVISDPMSFCQVDGISEKMVKKLVAQTEILRYRNELVKLFDGLIPLPETQFRRLRAMFSNQRLSSVISTLEAQPYCLQDAGYTFQEVDEFALAKAGIAGDSPVRLAAALRQVLLDASQQAHVGLPPQDAAISMVQQLSVLTPNVGAVQCQSFVEYQASDYGYVVDSGLVYFAGGYAQERDVARKLSQMAKQQENVNRSAIRKRLRSYEKEKLIQLAPEQEDAILCCMEQHVCIITGGPGTGKSTILDALLYVWQRELDRSDWCLLAPTGRAARRMAEATGQAASTIHAALQMSVRDVPLWYTQGGTEVTLSNSLVIVDEASIVDLPMMAALCAAMPDPSQRLVIVGDPEQLPSVGPGNILADLIASGKIPLVRLTKVFRQAAGSPILDNAERIRNGDALLDWNQRSCRRYNYVSDAENAEAACRLYVRCVNAYGIDSTMLLTPYRKKTDLCSNVLNVKLQDALNPDVGQPHISGFGKTFRLRDRVMQLKNTELVSNGDIGTITRIGSDGDGDLTATVVFEGGETVSYTSDDLAQLDLAYAFSVHKAQGSQAQNVLLLLPHRKTSFLRRNLFYTAITRAETNLAVFGSLDGIESIIANNRADLRYTRLEKRLKEM